MILKWGAYSHDNNELTFKLRKTPIYSDIGVRRGIRETWTITGWKQAANQAALTTALGALETAYATGGKDLIFYLDDGTTATQHGITNSATTGGTKVRSLRYLDSKRDEYIFRRTYQIVVEADIFAPTTETVSYTESLRQIGTGGPRFVYLPSITGSPQFQITQLFTPYVTIQSGHAVGETTWPTPPAPLFPTYEHVDKRVLDAHTPRYDNGDALEYRISWRYVFESALALTGNPTSL